MLKYEENLTSPVNGVLQPMLGVKVTVTASNGLQATLYADNEATVLANPVETDANGYFGFKAANGEYELTFSGPQIKTAKRTIELYDADDEPPLTQAQAALPTASSRIGFLPNFLDASPMTVEQTLRRILDRVDRPEPAKAELIAHRGFMNLFPQNTMAAFSGAYALGADALECDVQISADGVPVVIHDANVDATTNGTGSVSSLTIAQLKTLDAGFKFSAKFSGARIPTFTEFVEYAKGRVATIYPEIKGYRSQSDINLMLDVVEAASMDLQCVFQSFNLSDLQYVRARNARVRVGLLGSNINDLPSVAALGRSMMLFNFASVLANPAWVQECRERNVDVGCWTVDQDSVFDDLRKIGVTKVMSNTCIGGTPYSKGMPMAADNNFGDVWLTETAGGGSVAVSGGMATCTDLSATDSARKRMYLNAAGGDVVRLEVWARARSGTGRVGFDYNGAGTLINDVKVDWSDWRRVVLRAAVPSSQGLLAVSAFVGTYLAEVGIVDFFDPRLYIESSKFAASQVVAKGLIGKLAGAPPAVRPTYVNNNIASVAVTNTNQLKVALATGTFNPNPNIFVSCTRDTPKHVYAGGWANEDRSFLVDVFNMDGTPCNLAALATNLYFFVEVKI